MSSESQHATPKTKKRVRQLVTYFEEFGTPVKVASVSEPELVPQEVEGSPPKKRKTKEVPEEDTVVMEVTHTEVVAEEVVEEAAKPKESRSARKSRRLKENTMAKFSKRVFSAMEVLTTERTYVEGLQHLHKVRSR
jgi:hypothetical protein